MASLRAKGRKDFQRELLNPAMGMSKMKKITLFLTRSERFCLFIGEE